MKSAQETARKALCMGNEKQVGLAIRMYIDDNDEILLPGLSNPPAGVSFIYHGSPRSYFASGATSPDIHQLRFRSVKSIVPADGARTLATDLVDVFQPDAGGRIAHMLALQRFYFT